MGVLVKYKIENLEAAEVVLIGEALDLLPHGRVAGLVAKIQPQLTAQDIAERDRVQTEVTKAKEAWLVGEREKIRVELAAKQPKRKRKTRKGA
jgi:hypothetical protein